MKGFVHFFVMGWVVAACWLLAAGMAYWSFTQMQGLFGVALWTFLFLPISLLVAIVVPLAYNDIFFD